MMMRDPLKHFHENIEPEIITTLQQTLSTQLTEEEKQDRNRFIHDFLFNE